MTYRHAMLTPWSGMSFFKDSPKVHRLLSLALIGLVVALAGVVGFSLVTVLIRQLAAATPQMFVDDAGLVLTSAPTMMMSLFLVVTVLPVLYGVILVLGAAVVGVLVPFFRDDESETQTSTGRILRSVPNL